MSDNHGSKIDKCNDGDWEIVELEESHQEHADEAIRPILGLYCSGKFALQINGRENTRRTVLPEPGRHNYKFPIFLKNHGSLYDEQAQCILFRLPIELRLRIYEEVLRIKSPKVQLKWYPASHRTSPHLSVLSIIETCRRIHAEAEPIFYSINYIQYSVTTPRPSTSFFQTISPTRLESIRSLIISVSSGGEALHIIRELMPLTKLQKLMIERQQCVRYIDIQAWIVLAKQLKMELEKLSELQILDIITPETPKQTPEEEQRMRRLDQVDDFLREVTSENKRPAVA
ncbi:hypothetical protein VFPPC_09417 [Pochonia chlamydosporia 170]|uniref:Uncharacterized protein n=1 Tax=Pochonia chlamydosporia 170 TaxID=1380566 RepID=A0A179F7Y8_METCM|nr:hypothetical protein VFPPC_09417 [Pochonia chlamydosporia 170]OAQ61595.1 hypothetical protein VFPPC_09417 [Pochonia chlamydosporia 170]